MNYLIEINVPGEGWRPFAVNRGRPLRAVLARVRELYQGDDIHDTRVKHLETRDKIILALRDINNWKKNDRATKRRRN